MGFNPWKDEEYVERNKAIRARGASAFTYTDEEMRKVGREKWRVNQKMDPRDVVRESRDSATHPESLAIMVIFDHTGSMGAIPRVLQSKLGTLMGLLLEKRYAEHPQVLFGAVGDAVYDAAPLQTGQFESGIQMDEDLGCLLLEGGGGPMGNESYELAIYFAARHTAIDCWEKRKKKGYLFLMGDEMPYSRVKANEIRKIIGDDLGQDVSLQEIVTEAKQKYEIFFLIPTGANWGNNPDVIGEWVSLLGQESVIRLDYPEAISETIALIIGLMEGQVNLKNGLKNLEEAGLNPQVIKSIGDSLNVLPKKNISLAGKKTSDKSEVKKGDKGEDKPGRL